MASYAVWVGARHPEMPASFLGDLNILEPGHLPHHPFFAPFEYDFYGTLTTRHGLIDAFRLLHPDTVEHSWVGRTGDGYRYDHVFCSTALAHTISGCAYLHQPRTERLSDHSALTARLTVKPLRALLVSDPATAAQPATLF